MEHIYSAIYININKCLFSSEILSLWRPNIPMRKKQLAPDHFNLVFWKYMFLMERVVNTNFCVQTKFCNYDGLKFRSAKTSFHGIISFRSKIYANIRINTNCVRVKFCHYDDLQFRSAKTSWCGIISIFLKTVYVSKCMMDRVIHISNEILSLWLPKIPKRKDQLSCRGGLRRWISGWMMEVDGWWISRWMMDIGD